MLTKQAIEKFQKIYLSEYGIEISFDDAVQMAEQLINLYKGVLSQTLNNQQKMEVKNVRQKN